MKNKNLIVGLGVAVLLYFIFKSKKGKQVTEQVSEKVKETVKPTKELITREVVSRGDTRVSGKQLLKITNSLFSQKTPFKDYTYRVPQNDRYIVENSKGETRDVLKANRSNIVIDENVSATKRSGFLLTGDTFKIYKTKF